MSAMFGYPHSGALVVRAMSFDATKHLCVVASLRSRSERHATFLTTPSAPTARGSEKQC